MCYPASFIITRERTLWLKDSDSHEDIIEYYKCREGEFVRVEISPPNKNYRLPINKWVYKTDQDILPEWHSDKFAEEMCRLELPKWYKTHVITGGSHSLSGKISKVILGGIVHVAGQTGGYCCFYGNSQGKVTGQTGGVCWFYDNSQGKVTGQTGGDCWFYDNSQGKVTGQTGGYCCFYGNSQKVG